MLEKAILVEIQELEAKVYKVEIQELDSQLTLEIEKNL